MITGLLVDVARGAAIVLAASAAARVLLALCDRRLVVALLATWVAVPALAVAYAWATLPGLLLPDTALAQLLHLLLAALRLAPVVLLVVGCVPPPPWSAAAFHCLRLRSPTRRGPAVRWWTAGPGRRWLVAALVVFPLAFGEFELGSRLGTASWAVRLFDAQAGGQYLSVTLAAAAPGVAIQLAALLAAWRLLRGGGARTGEEPPAAAAPAPPLRAGAWVLLLGGSAALVVLPVATVVLQAGQGLDVVVAQATTLRRELGASLVFAGVASAAAWVLAALLLPAWSGRAGAPAPSRMRGVLVLLALIPGLCGSLVIGLAGLALVQLPPLRGLAGTPLPLVAALVALVLPSALLLRWMAGSPLTGAAWHQVRLLQPGDAAQAGAARSLRWQLVGRRQWWAVTLLFLWTYCDLAASAILHPVDMTPVLVRLYNLMHYGQSTALAVQVLMALLAPLLVLVLVYALVRLPPWHALVRRPAP